MALLFARGGAQVIANYARDDDAAAAVVRDAQGVDGTVEICRADVTTADGRQRLLETIGHAPLSAFVHCAATGVHRPLEQLTTRHWEFTFALNSRAFFELVQALLPRFGAGSSIVAVSSEGAAHAFPGYTLVGASKGALEALSRHLAVELAPRGIRVNILSPGTVLTTALDALPNRDDVVGAAERRVPRGTLTTCDEVAAAAQFLCSDASAGVNGHTLVVDGGQRIRG
jgi:enoyl-[acyl-carrier protein] reductase III